jgi:hypothetical protein
MSALLVGLSVFALALAGGLLGVFLHGRLPVHHKESDSKDVVKLVMGLIATIAALVLSLLIATAHTSYQTQESEVQALGVHILQLDAILASYGPDANEARAMLREAVAVQLKRIWPDDDGANVNLRAPIPRDSGPRLFAHVANLQATTDAQRFARSRALQLLTDIGETRGLLYEQAGSSLSWPFFVILVFWVVMLFVGFGFLTRGNPTVLVALFVGALSIAGAIFLILEMNRPYSGFMKISSAPIQNALAAIGH